LQVPGERITLIGKSLVEVRMPTRIAGIPPMAVLILLVMAATSIVDAQSESLRSIASELAGTIEGASRQGAVHDPAVLVKDFAQTHGERTALGPKLADQFSKALIDTQGPGPLGTHLPVFQVLEAGESPSIPDNDLEDHKGECHDPELGARFIVEGYIDVLPETIVLRIVTTRTRDKKAIFDERITLPLDAEMRSALAKPMPEPRAPSKNEPVNWVRPGFRVEDGEKAPHGEAAKGYTQLRCIYCPNAGYTDAAIAVKIQGTVTMDVLFDKHGLPAEIAIVDGMPCGLNKAAVDSVARWRMTPAMGPDGKSAAVWSMVEVNFQLF
jgi:Gram-negative bacterial TonB protein C-terminal